MNNDSLDSKLVILVEKYIDKFTEIPPIFCDSLSEYRKKELLNQALLANKPIENKQPMWNSNSLRDTTVSYNF